MLHSIITQNQDGQNLFNAISSFFSTFGIFSKLMTLLIKSDLLLVFLL